MKQLCIIILTLFSIIAFAGSSAEDPIVAMIRQKFAAGSTPTAKYLLENKFNCTVIFALKGMFDHINTGKRRFTYNEALDVFKTSEYNSLETFFTFQGKELWGTAQHPRVQCSVDVAYRKSTDGNLIGESSSHWCFNALEVDESISPNSFGKVRYYTVCRPIK